MAILVAAGGAALGSAVGIGPSAGWLIGSVVGNLLFPRSGPEAATEGPRLGDLSVTSAAYGMPIAIGYGTLRMAGNLIWSSGIREVRTVEEHATGGKGGGGATQTAFGYAYFASFAVAFGEGPAEDVLRLWADGKLVYDKTGASAELARSGLDFRFYPGDEAQLPDGLIEADVGTGQAPAHRGLCYLVFEDLPLTDFGNRIPNITAEITHARAGTYPSVAFTNGCGWTTLHSGSARFDWNRGTFFLSGEAGGAGKIGKYDAGTLAPVLCADWQSLLEPASPNKGRAISGNHTVLGNDGACYVAGDDGAHLYLSRHDAESLAETDWSARYPEYDAAESVTVYGPTGPRHFLVLGWTLLDSAIRILSLPSLQSVHYDGLPRAGAIFEGQRFADGFTEFHVVEVAASAITIFRYRLAWNVALDPLTGQTQGIERDQVDTITEAEIGEGGLSLHYKWKTDADGGLIFAVRATATGNAYIVKWHPEAGLLWTAGPLNALAQESVQASDRMVGPHLATAHLWTITLLDKATGAVVETLDAEPWGRGYDGFARQVWDGKRAALYGIGSSAGGTFANLLHRGSGEGAALSAIVTDLCGRVGLDGTDLDVAELSEIVPGYVIGRQTPARGAVEPLATAYRFDGVESDDRLAFRKRGRAPVASLQQRDLVPLDADTGEPWRERRSQEVELPERVSVLYLDTGLDYQQGAQSDKRAALPTPTMHARSQLRLDLPLALDATTAKRIASETLYAAWRERATYEAQLPWTWLALEPTDVIDVTLDSGTLFRARITRIDVGADLVMAVDAVAEDPASYGSSLLADSGAGVPAQAIAAPATTRLFVLDLPLLRDVDDLAGIGSRVYWAAGGYGSSGWPGAALYKSADGTSWTRIGTGLTEAAWGAAANALGDPPSPWATDETNTLTVFMTTGDERLAAVTQTELLNGANAAVLLKAEGEPEIIQFRDVMQNADGSFTLSGLLRGRRGSEVYATGHRPGELFLLLEGLALETVSLGLGELDVARSWKGVGFGARFEDAEPETRSNTGRDLKPYAPVHLAGSRDGSGDLTVTWKRRTRIGGDWRDGTGAVPLGEDTEAYDLDILDGPGGAVIRTITGLTSPTAVYTAAQQIADFGAPQAQVHLALHQVSAAVGRGFPATASL